MSSSNNNNNNNNRISVNCGIYLKSGDATDTNCCFILTMMCLLQHKVFKSRDTFFDFIISAGNLTPSLKKIITKESKSHQLISDDFIPIITRMFGIKITLVSDGISRDIGDDDNKEHYYVFYENNHYQPMLSRHEVLERKEWINANKKMQETLENKLISDDEKFGRSLDKSTSENETPIAISTATLKEPSTVTSTETSKNDSISFTSFLERLEQAKRISLNLFKREQQQEKDFELSLKYQIDEISNFESNSNSFDIMTEEDFVIV